MGCNCGGSQRVKPQPAERDKKSAQPARERRQGGPADKGSTYYFSGPKRDK
jgi:hypothetical protein